MKSKNRLLFRESKSLLNNIHAVIILHVGVLKFAYFDEYSFD